jgi:DNA-nicking Smr family endonuclease
MEIEARLDLHGMTLAEAQPAVHDFIRRHHAAGTRCVLIITGKGKTGPAAGSIPWYEPGRGGIRRDFTRWLEAPDLRPLILSVSPARAAHGGAGAFYVLLRRKR